MRKPKNINIVSMINTIYDDDDAVIMPIKERIEVQALATVIMIFDSNGTEEYDELIVW